MIPTAVAVGTLVASLAAIWKVSNERGEAFQKWRGRRDSTLAALRQNALERLRELYGEMSKLPDLASPTLSPETFRAEAQAYLRPLDLIGRFDRNLNGLHRCLDVMLVGGVLGAAGAAILVLDKIGVTAIESFGTAALWAVLIALVPVVGGFSGKVLCERAMVQIELEAQGVGAS